MQQRKLAPTPLVVDLDGTLLNSDLIDECLARRLHSGVFFREFFLYPFWLMKGIPEFKRRLAHGIRLDIKTLPLNSELLNYLRLQSEQHRAIYLVSASDHNLVEQVGRQLNIFTACYGTQGSVNLRGLAKVELLRSKGIVEFCYAGNSSSDIPIWQQSQAAVLVNASAGIRKQIDKVPVELEIRRPTGFWKSLLKGMRPHQWAKNLLIAVPIFTSHQVFAIEHWLNVLPTFAAFCMVASGVYLLNDVVDIEADRIHRTKRNRPLASGVLSIRAALLGHILLVASGLGMAFALNERVGAVVLTYFAITCAYSFYLKSLMVADATVLSLLYIIRVVAGHAATGVKESYWLYTFSGFIFLSLAFLKRHVEIGRVTQAGDLAGRGYNSRDGEIVSQLGVSAGMTSVLVLALYIHSNEVLSQYAEPRVLWLALPIMLTWIVHIWSLAHRGRVHDDPLIFALKDRFSYFVLALLGIVAFGAKFWNF